MQETGLVSGMLRRSASVPENLILRNILLATDFSEFSTRALGYALGIASRLKARLHLFHCIDRRPYGFADPGEVETARDDVRRERTHVDDATAFVSQHHREDLACHLEHAEEINVEDSAPLGSVKVLEWAIAAQVSSIVYQNVDVR